MDTRKYPSNEYIVDTARFGVSSKHLTLTHASVTKGDYDGHPFRGNQWSDSSGSSRDGAGNDVEHIDGELMSSETLAALVDKSTKLLKKVKGPAGSRDDHRRVEMADALVAWKSIHTQIAKYLRGENENPTYKHNVDGLIDRFETAAVPLQYDTKLFRGLGWRKGGLEIKVGQILSDKSFQSTTNSDVIANYYTKEALMIINAPKGTRVLPAGDILQQLILDRNTKFLVTNIKDNTPARLAGNLISPADEITVQIVGD